MTEPRSVVTEPAPMTGSERVRRARERKRDDVIFIGIEILPKERDAPIRTGLLAKADRNNKKAVRDALCAYFEKHLDPEARP